jgi:propanol-preferring alcohol dehydrogenase
MKSWVLHEPRDLRLEDRPRPEPGPGEIVLRVLACGICHTDLHEVLGEIPLPILPIGPGHQIVGEVTALGPGAARFKPGDRVGVPWLYGTCGVCEYCRTERENLCDAARFTGLHADGGFAEYHRIHEAFAHPLPPDRDPALLAPLLCGGAIGYRAYRLAGLAEGPRTVGLWGFGSSAHQLLQIAKARGHTVFVFTRGGLHRDLALALGADWAGSSGDTPPALLDAGIVFAPVGALMIEGLKSLKKGGRMVSAGIHMDDLPSFPYRLLWEERTLTSVANLTRRDVADLLAVTAGIDLKIEVERYAFGELPKALERLAKGEIRGSAVLCVPPDQQPEASSR